MGYDIIPGTGFTIHARSDNRMSEPVIEPRGANSTFQLAATTINNKNAQPANFNYGGGRMPMVYGLWTVAWVWL